MVALLNREAPVSQFKTNTNVQVTSTDRKSKFICPITTDFNRQQGNEECLNINFSIECKTPEYNFLISLIAVEGVTFKSVWDLRISPTNTLFECYSHGSTLFRLLLQNLLINVAEMIAGIDTLCFIISNRYIALLCPVVDYSNLMFFLKMFYYLV